MKRLSNKKRKLQYIREKNHYRLGGEGVVRLHFVDEIMDDHDFVQQEIKIETKIKLDRLSKKYKMKFSIDRIKIGRNNDDFINGITTVLYSFKNSLTV